MSRLISITGFTLERSIAPACTCAAVPAACAGVVEEKKLVAEIQPLLPRVEDTFQVFVRELRASDLDGSAGVYRLREELLRRVNVAVYPAKVDAVLFKDIILQ